MTGLCHCRYCQLRTGSAFGISIYFPTNCINIMSGHFDKYSYNSASGGKVQVDRCKICGTSLFWELELKELQGSKGTTEGGLIAPNFLV